jgi:hypothetical protein
MTFSCAEVSSFAEATADKPETVRAGLRRQKTSSFAEASEDREGRAQITDDRRLKSEVGRLMTKD